ncbi:SAM-dependent methyltransferase [Pseudonocardia sp. ICBG1293]|uniref:SAM-dependent methyltransferase n=1 Tax=Pseudonocardia sp. ICBG1293 TaxID=2844382 RepID=UPI001CCAA790|nr:SAM-dependent methyltransferase [Pseudonocardia sp. ICBG1293]
MRTADDQWDITSSVGATALAVAAGRALETRRADRLVDDPLAQRFVDAAGTVSGLPQDPGDPADPWVVQAGYQGVRSRFFDEALTGAGATQVVLLAAGLDARALRLAWPAGTTVFEVDQPEVLAFKDRVVGESGVTPTARRVTVPVDLRHDWPAALVAAGLDPARPTVWLAEGLLPYLPADAERLLFERVHALSVPGSRIAVEHFGDQVERIADEPSFRAAAQEMLDTDDVGGLFFAEPRPESCDAWLRRHGWAVTGRPVREVAAGYGRPLDASVADTLGGVTLLWADRP